MALDSNGNIIKTDPHDVGVPMKPAPAGWVHRGPEDALDSTIRTRGDYTGRQDTSTHTTGQTTFLGRYDTAPAHAIIDQGVPAVVLDDPGGPLDQADPNYAALLAQRQQWSG